MSTDDPFLSDQCAHTDVVAGTLFECLKSPHDPAHGHYMCAFDQVGVQRAKRASRQNGESL